MLSLVRHLPSAATWAQARMHLSVRIHQLMLSSSCLTACMSCASACKEWISGGRCISACGGRKGACSQEYLQEAGSPTKGQILVVLSCGTIRTLPTTQGVAIAIGAQAVTVCSAHAETMNAWAAKEKWTDLAWWCSEHGHRTVPLEVGAYRAPDWHEAAETINSFVTNFLGPSIARDQQRVRGDACTSPSHSEPSPEAKPVTSPTCSKSSEVAYLSLIHISEPTRPY